MDPATVAVVVSDPSLREEVARAFDSAPQAWAVSFWDAPPSSADVVVFDDPSAGSGVVFDPRRPDELVGAVQTRLDESRRPPSSRVVGVTGVAGAGVTTLALHLASTWAVRSDTCFLDLDQSWGCAPRLGLGDETITWNGADRSSEALKLASLPLQPRLRVLVAPHAPVETRCASLVTRARAEFERLVIDVPVRHRDPEVTASVDAVIVVLAPCLPHAHRAARMLTQIDAERVVVVTNRLGPGGETTRQQLEAILGRKVSLELPCCPSLRDAEGSRRLASLRWSRWGYGVKRLARALDTA
jgi:Flp pilus assembly CpaE family ATPase